MTLSQQFRKHAWNQVVDKSGNVRRGRPQQINLRRSLSSAYYALFHLLSEQVAQQLAPAFSFELRSRVVRSLQHGEMKAACLGFQGSSVSNEINKLGLLRTVSPALSEVARTFIDLQEQRNIADYDGTVTFALVGVLNLLNRMNNCFETFAAIESTDEGKVFLAALAFGKRWGR